MNSRLGNSFYYSTCSECYAPKVLVLEGKLRRIFQMHERKMSIYIEQALVS